MNFKQRLERIAEARKGTAGTLVMPFTYQGDDAALQAHDAAVEAKEREGFKIYSVIHGAPASAHRRGDVVISRSYAP
jgi:hypothetical protein